MFDPAVNIWLQALASPWLDQFFLWITALGDELAYTLLLPALYWLTDRRNARQVALVFLVSMSLNGILKEWLALPRPNPADGVRLLIQETSPGFPSGHAQGSSTLWTSLALAYGSRLLGWLAAILIPLICLSRLYLGVHYLADILGGLALGFGLVALFFTGYRRGWGNRWPVGVKALLIILAMPILLFLNPNSGAVRILGFLSGFLLGDWVGRHALAYRPQGSPAAQVGKLLLGYGGFFAIVYLVERWVPAGLPSLLGYGLAALWVTVGAPWLFLTLGLTTREWGPGGPLARRALGQLGSGALVVALLLGLLAWWAGAPLGRLPAVAGLQPGVVQVIAHRGGALEAPENTLVAFGQAETVGATALELDVHLTADGHVVVLHDSTVDRTTNGTGPIAHLTLDQVRELDAAYHYSPDGSTYPLRGVGIGVPTLEEVLQAHPETPLIIEMKINEPRLAEEVARLVEAYGAASRVVVSSFHREVLDHFRSLAPGVATGFSLPEALHFVLLERLGLSFLYPGPPGDVLQVPERYGLLPVASKNLIERAAEWGLPVQIWTVNDRDAMRRWAVLGAAGIITDAPSTLVEVLRQEGTRDA